MWPGAQGRRQYLERSQLAIGTESKVRLNEDSIPLFDAHDDTAVLEAPAAQTNLKARRPACEGMTLESGVDNLHIVRGLVRTQPQYVNRNTVIGGDPHRVLSEIVPTVGEQNDTCQQPWVGDSLLR